MGRFTPPAAAGIETLDELTDVDTSAGDGLADGAPLSYDSGASLWTPQLVSPLSAKRSSGPALDVIQSVAITSDEPTAFADGVGFAMMDGAVWTVGSDRVSRYDATPDGLHRTTGTTATGIPAASASQGVWLASAGGYVYVRADDDQSFHRILDIDTVTTLTGIGYSGEAAIVGIGDRVFTSGGGSGGYTGIYEPWSDSWTALSKPPIDTGSGRHDLVYHDGSVYLFGPDTTNQPTSDNVWRYDLATDTWTQLNDGPSGISFGNLNRGWYVLYGSLIYVFDEESPYLWLYDPAADVWEEQAPTGSVPEPSALGARGGALGIINSRIVGITGYNSAFVYG